MPSTQQPTTQLPDSIRDVEHLEDLLSALTPGVIETVRKIDGDFIVLGVGGKMGPTLARMLRRAIDAAGIKRRVIGVSRFSTSELPDQLRRDDIEPIACDLLDPHALAKLPEVKNVVYLAGMKFGTTGQQARTWAMNAYLPGMVRKNSVIAGSSHFPPAMFIRLFPFTPADAPKNATRFPTANMA